MCCVLEAGTEHVDAVRQGPRRSIINVDGYQWLYSAAAEWLFNSLSKKKKFHRDTSTFPISLSL